MNYTYSGKIQAAKIASMVADNNNSVQTHSLMANNCWIADSGSTNHMTINMSNPNLSTPYIGSDEVQVANGANLPISDIGSTTILTPTSSF